MCKFGDGWYQIEQVPKKISLHSRVVFANSSDDHSYDDEPANTAFFYRLRLRKFGVFTLAIRTTFVEESQTSLILLLNFKLSELAWPKWQFNYQPNSALRSLGMKLTRLPPTSGPFVFSGGGGIFLFQLLLNKPAIKERILFYLRKSRRRTLPQFEYLWQDSRRLLSDGCSKSGILSDR